MKGQKHERAPQAGLAWRGRELWDLSTPAGMNPAARLTLWGAPLRGHEAAGTTPAQAGVAEDREATWIHPVAACRGTYQSTSLFSQLPSLAGKPMDIRTLLRSVDRTEEGDWRKGLQHSEGPGAAAWGTRARVLRMA